MRTKVISGGAFGLGLNSNFARLASVEEPSLHGQKVEEYR